MFIYPLIVKEPNTFLQSNTVKLHLWTNCYAREPLIPEGVKHSPRWLSVIFFIPFSSPLQLTVLLPLSHHTPRCSLVNASSPKIYVNPCLKVQLMNICAASADEKIVLDSSHAMTLEEALEDKYKYMRTFSSTVSRRADALEGITETERIRNIAIIAHVDHRKMTLIDQLLRQSGPIKQLTTTEQLLFTPTTSSATTTATTDSALDNGFITCVMGSNSLEHERGITILSRCTGVRYNGNLINIVDTPGHADFGGEVERIMSMVDNVALVVDVTEGLMIDMVRIEQSAQSWAQIPQSDLFDLFVMLGATDKQGDYLYSMPPQNKAGPATRSLKAPIHTSARSTSGASKAASSKSPTPPGDRRIGEQERVEHAEASAGGIDSVAGIMGGGVNVTLMHYEGWGAEGPQALPTTPIDPSAMSIFIHASDSSMVRREGTKLISQLICERIFKEAEANVALKILPGPTSKSLKLRGRGVLHMDVLLETLHREGFELSVGSPKAVMFPNLDPSAPSGSKLERIEEVTVLVKEVYAGGVMQKLMMRKGEMISYDVDDAGGGWVKAIMDIPARGLIGYMAGEFKNDHGQGTINHMFKGYELYKGAIDTGRNGALISMARGESAGYAMAPLQARRTLFIPPQTQVYPGMVVSESSKFQDIYINPCVKK
ncbi:hypothetical protein BDQ12DRAFT_726121 [Crucibulum laeve]|uniref:Tr-type G domain-containing protein n=1 Tax=Crucibulum laeve TaxID=68775 RepID=A0A5C3LQD9_9AGAR|nr:hypothetical protein BDQ12DRAFT_726121 [Crucibulum laeve]